MTRSARPVLALLLATPIGACDLELDLSCKEPDVPPTAPTCIDEGEVFSAPEYANLVREPAGLPYAGEPGAPSFVPAVARSGATPGAGFDVSGDFVGAIGDVNWTEGWVAFPAGETPADRGEVLTVGADGAHTVLDVDAAWPEGATVRLRGTVWVNANLAIGPGVVVKGGPEAALVVTARGRLEAKGVAGRPVVFTSARSSPLAVEGDWRGVFFLGRAPVQTPQDGVGMIAPLEAPPARPELLVRGGNAPGHSCGELRYVRVEYSGEPLWFAGCGTGTVVEQVQAHRSPGISVWGGTMQLRRVLMTSTWVGLVWGNGWTGGAQYLICQTRPDGQGCLGQSFIADGWPGGSRPVLWNVTAVGAIGAWRGLSVFSGFGVELHNAILTGFAAPVDLGPGDVGAVRSGLLTVTHSVLDGPWFEDGNDCSGGSPGRPGCPGQFL